MKFIDFRKVRSVGFIALFVFLAAAVPADAQSSKKPLFQDIVVRSGQPSATPRPGIRKTGSSSRSNVPRAISVGNRMVIPALADVNIPGYSGVLVESLNGDTVIDSYSDTTFNPASNVKVATAYAVLKTFGVNYRFRTDVWTDGQIDQTTGTLNGNIYVSGRDPMFNLEHGVHLAHELNRLGINSVNGDLIVTDNFAMNYSPSSARSGRLLKKTLDGTARSGGASKAWYKHRSNSLLKVSPASIPSVNVSGDLYVEGLPTNARLLMSHESTPLREIVKVTLSYSNNFLSERLGDMLGGAYAVARIVQMDAGVLPGHFTLQTCSGLGINRVTPRAQLRLLKTFRNYLAQNRMSFSDVMAVAGMDDGTLRRRFNKEYNIGSVVGKTGTLGRTDGGVSTLSGQVTTAYGQYIFVIFNQRGSVGRFRSFQNSFVPLLQDALGGAARTQYMPQTMARRLAKTRVSYPDSRRRRSE